MRRPRIALSCAFATLGLASIALANDPPHGHRHVKPQRVQTERDAGFPSEISPHAVPTLVPGYGGYYVGGGWSLHRRKNAASVDDGTFGWDYTGRGHFRPRVNLGFSRRFRQGAGGTYATEGPKVLEPLIERAREHHEPAEH